MTVRIPISDIRIGERHRKDMGDLQALAESIRQRGQLIHPIVVTSKNLLVVGERRLRACRDILKWKDIECTVIDVVSPLEWERDENDIRLNFTLSEKAALAKAIEAEAPERRGRPKTEDPDPSLFGEEETDEQGDAEIVGNCRQFPAGRKTEDVAAEDAGFGSARDYRRVKKAVEEGTPDLVDAMDRGDIAPSVAATIAHLPKPEQEKVVAQGPEAMKAKAKELREKAPPMPPEDKEAEAKARRGEGWHKAMHDLWKTLNGVRDFGGMDTLSDKWSRDGQAKVLADLNRIRSTIDEWISVLEQKLEE